MNRSMVAPVPPLAASCEIAYNTIYALKKKMHCLKTEKENASDRVDQLEQKLSQQKNFYDKQNEEVLLLEKRVFQTRNDLELTNSQLLETNEKLETNTKLLTTTETEVASLTKQVRTLEDDFEQTEARLAMVATKLEMALAASDESERVMKVLENRNIVDEERIQQLERELEMTVLFGEDADRKFEMTARRLAVVEVDLDRVEATLGAAEAKILDLDEQVKVVGNNRKSLEIAEQEAALREDQHEQLIVSIKDKLKIAEERATTAERNVTKLQKEVDRLEGELGGERDMFRQVANELDLAFTELTGY